MEDNKFFYKGIITFLVIGILIVVGIGLYLLYGIYLPNEMKAKNEVVRNLCIQNNLEFIKGSNQGSSIPYCYKQEGIIRIRYYAPEFWQDDFKENKTLWYLSEEK